jgi:phage repressor protein C with HTH and peptisase S24 domain
MNDSPVPFNTNGIGTRIEEAAAKVGGKRGLSKMIDISEAQLYRIIAEESSPKIETLVAIANATGVSVTWLAIGDNTAESDSAEHIQEYDFVPLYDAQCSAGNGSWNENAQVLTKLAFTSYSLRKKGLDPKMLSAIRVDGDSMEGDLSDGDAVMVDHSKTDVKGEGIYVIRLDGHLYAKRLQRTFDGIDIISTNRAYKAMSVPKDRIEELEVIGQVVWSASWCI